MSENNTYYFLIEIRKNKIELDCPLILPDYIYRYFDTNADRDNFVNGANGIWFAGVNQNRFRKWDADPTEYCVPNSNWHPSIQNVYTLSFQLHKPDNNQKFWIKIIDVKGFLQALCLDLQSQTMQACHQVEFFDKKKIDELIKKAEREDIRELNIIRKEKSPNKEKLIGYVGVIIGRDLTYVNKEDYIDTSSSESVGIAYKKTEKKKSENEWRIEIHMGGLQYHLVKHIKCRCLMAQKYCLLI